MLYPTAGSRIYIADLPGSSRDDLPTTGWVEIGEAEGLGILAGRWETEETAFPGYDVDPSPVPTRDYAKSVVAPAEMQIVMGLNPADAGQALIWKAYRSESHFPFRLVFPDGVFERQWWALVLGVGEAFDQANNVMKLQADLLPHYVHRSEDV